MNRSVWTMGVVIISQIGYHIGQKAVHPSASPFIVLATAYATACLVCVATISVIGRMPSPDELRASIGWPTWVVALSIIGIEVGYLLAYRTGWPISLAFAVASTLTVVALAAIGVAYFSSSLHPRRLAGIALACLGMWLLASGDEA